MPVYLALNHLEYFYVYKTNGFREYFKDGLFESDFDILRFKVSSTPVLFILA